VLKIAFKAILGMDEKQSWLAASTLLNLLFSVAKLWVGWVLGSTLVTADGIHSLSDVFGSLLILLALRVAARSFSLFPIGLNKLEDLAALLGAIAIFVAGYEIVRAVFLEGTVATSDASWSIMLFVAVIISIEYGFYRAEKKAAKRLNSPGVETDAINWLGDIGAGLVVIAGLFGATVGLPYAQEAAVVIIVGLIFQGGYEILRNSLLSLLDASAKPAILEQARAIIGENSDIAAIDSLVIRASGSIYLGSLAVQVKENNAKKAHQVVDQLERELKGAISGLEVMNIHYEPAHHAGMNRATLLDADKQSIATQLGKAAWVRLEKLDDNNAVLHSELVPVVLSPDTKFKPVKLIAMLIKWQVDEVLFAGEHSDLIMLLDALGIRIVMCPPAL
jgi:cation diffusion facilitator family transporter